MFNFTFRFDPRTTKSGIEELEIDMRTYRHLYNKTLKCDDVLYLPVSFQANKFPLSPNNVTFVDIGPNEKQFKHQNQNMLINEIPLNIKDDLIRTQNDGTCNGRVEVCEPENVGREYVTFKINQPQDQLVSFGIFGRIFTRDVDHNKPVTDQDVEKFETILDVIYGVK